MPSSPRTPNRRRKSSNLESPFSPTSSQTNGYHSTRPPYSRRTSSYSIQPPLTPRPISSHSRNGDFGSSSGFETATNRGSGLGNLADELAEAWDEGGEEDGHARSLEDSLNGYGGRINGHITPPQLASPSSISNHIPSSPLPSQDAHTLSPTKPSTRSKNRRKSPSQYDGSDYGSEPEEVDGISPSLEARMAAIEHLARRGTEANGSDADTVIPRVAERLRDLGSQSGVENGVSRYYCPISPHLSALSLP